MKYEYLIIGGDDRFKYLYELLKQRGHKTLAIELKGVNQNAEFEEIKMAKTIIGPIPLIKNDKINGTNIEFEKILPYIKDQNFVCGMIDNNLNNLLKDRNVKIYDVMKDDSFAIYNSIATAEGAIAEAITLSPFNLSNRKVLVLGYGKCAKTLSAKLKGLDADVYVAARKKVALSYANSNGLKTIDILDLADKIKDYKFIFNTIPALVIDKKIIKNIDNKAVLIDIASAPGGVDRAAVTDIKCKYKLSLGLPAKYSPLDSAEGIYKLLKDYIKNFNKGA